MDIIESKWEKQLKIHTTGRDDSKADTYRYPYEPTPYSVLERLANSGLIGKKNTLLDYGSGKGRVDIFMSYQTRCHSIGIDFDERMYRHCIDNKESSVCDHLVEFVNQSAENYIVPEAVDRVYFFNPFSVEILGSVIKQIFNSYYDNPREIYFMFYYPSDEYVAYLMSMVQLEFYDEIECMDLFEGENARERVLIFVLR